MSWPSSHVARSRRCRRLYPAFILAALFVMASAPLVGFTGVHLVAMVAAVFSFVGVAIDSSPRREGS